MRFPRGLSMVFVFVLCGSLAATSQSRSPETALEELVTTDKLEVLARHLPLAIEENIAHFTPADKVALEKQIAVPHLLSLSGRSLRKRDDGLGWDYQPNPARPPQLVRVKSTFYSGADALVLLETSDQEGMLALVTMRYEDGEWRLNDFGLAQMEGVATRLAEKLRPRAASEAVVVETLMSIHSALAEYASSYPEIGFPTKLQALGPDPNAPKHPAISVFVDAPVVAVPAGVNAPPSNDAPADSNADQEQTEDSQRPPADHAGLLDASYMADPLIIEGYRVRYTLIDGASGDDQHHTLGRFSITASPVEFGKTGTRNFYIDENGEVRFIEENREANADDPPLQHRQYGPVWGGLYWDNR